MAAIVQELLSNEWPGLGSRLALGHACPSRFNGDGMTQLFSGPNESTGESEMRLLARLLHNAERLPEVLRRAASFIYGPEVAAQVERDLANREIMVPSASTLSRMRLKLAPRQAMSASIAAHLSKCARASFMSLPPGPPLTPHTLAPSRTHPGPRAGPPDPSCLYFCILSLRLCVCVFVCVVRVWLS